MITGESPGTGAPTLGTLPGSSPEPPAVSLARELVEQGVSVEAGISRIVDTYHDLEQLVEAKTYWVRRVPRVKASWDDHGPTKALLMLEGAIDAVQPWPLHD